MKKWVTKRTSKAFKTNWFSIRKDDCITGDGNRIKDFYVIDSPNGAMVVPITDDGKIILVKQYRQSIGAQTLECPAGFVDKTDRSFAATAKRELLEETGYSAKKIRSLGGFYPYSAKLTTKVGIFLALGCKKEGAQFLDKAESIDIVEMDFKKAVGMVRAGKIDSCDTALAILLAEKELR